MGKRPRKHSTRAIGPDPGHVQGLLEHHEEHAVWDEESTPQRVDSMGNAHVALGTDSSVVAAPAAVQETRSTKDAAQNSTGANKTHLAARTAAAPAVARPLEAPEEDDSDEEDNTTRKRRKRTRKRKKGAYTNAEPGPDPSSDAHLNDSAQKSIAYAQCYLTDKSKWKFSKPRQNWLLRHMLWSDEIRAAASTLAAVEESERNAALSEDALSMLAPAFQIPEESAVVPDIYVPVVAVYLQSIMGLSKQRVIDALTVAAAASLPPPPPDASAESTEAQELPKAYTCAAAWCTLRAARAHEILQWIQARETAP
ncbi:hypothetical protein MVES1_001849 [Malassezia vespertilionis]|uniref:WKF domain-containing protein n=1 Tax=Malassezia vespertilionis TaxID=2020962 RepID=A0A2N1JD08_9BASI|nr:uncharacterized protein MVES1_001849 [Malassezia vespertilionis]PKI84423.1 hypothetical protein MVES_001749 [Malassezia vespertilionis]WFD06502.1 hypothetical protein MVES1_001849 [Malassezia vespertilionis]